MVRRPQKITLAKCESGTRRLLVYCGDYKCGHFIKIASAEADQWPDHLRISDLGSRFVRLAASEAP